MKTKEELNALREELETLNRKLAELNEDELKQVSGGSAPPSGVSKIIDCVPIDDDDFRRFVSE